MGVKKEVMSTAEKLLLELNSECTGNGNVELVEMNYDDSWMRDVGPTFLLDSSGETKKLYGVDWIFNAWGGLYTPYEMDNLVACEIIKLAAKCNNFEERVVKADFVLEGGSIHTDGEGTIITTEECLLNSNRNPGLSKEDIEKRLLQYLGGNKVIWLPKGLTGDLDTTGHVDNLCCFSKSGEILLSWTDDSEDDFYSVCREAHDILMNTTDAKGRKIRVVKLPIPPAMFYTNDDIAGLSPDSDGEVIRTVNERLAASYVNFYIANGAIICPGFGHEESDAKALQILHETFPGRKIEQVMSKEILLGGGNIHCITQQQPKSD